MEPWFAADPKSLNKAQRFITKDPAVKRTWDMYKFTVDRKDQAFLDQFLGTPTKNITTLKPDLDKLEKEYFTAIVVGNKPLDAFDEYVTKWRAQGGDKITEDVNVWFAAQPK
jgi:putative aldouronate transport system substrate-binding protein